MSDEALRAILAGNDDVLFAYVYGSENPHTDLDVALYLRETPADALRTAANWETRLQEAVSQPVDACILNSVHLEWAYAAQKGRLIYERDPDARIEFELRTQKEYWDWVPKLRVFLNRSLADLQEYLHASGRN